MDESIMNCGGYSSMAAAGLLPLMSARFARIQMAVVAALIAVKFLRRKISSRCVPGFQIMNPDYLFVYGSLRRTASGLHRYLACDAEYVADGSIQGRLYDINGYPGVIETVDVNERVVGELYRGLAMPALLERLDEYEECNALFPQPHEYVRKVLPITLSSGERMMAWVYVFNRDVAGMRHIRSGDYRESMMNQVVNASRPCRPGSSRASWQPGSSLAVTQRSANPVAIHQPPL
jgi:gamma-glutamylcyclotransferase (GGCT)/AIG2-like uncharacterized protein YtfP